MTEKNPHCFLSGTKTGKQLREKLRKNDLLINITTNNITELNDLIYAGAKLVCGKIGVSSKKTKKESKIRGEIRVETQVRKQRQQAKILKQAKNLRLCSDKQRKARRLEQNIELEEINLKVLAKEERLKRYRDRARQ